MSSRPSRRVALPRVLAVAAVFLPACGLLVGLGDDFTVMEDGGGGPRPPAPEGSLDGPSETGVEEAGEAGGGQAGSSGEEAGDDGPSACVPTAEDCANGIDDNCNGLVDCDDPDCADAGFECASPSAPPGWSWVVADDRAGAICARGTGPASRYLTAASAPLATCGCTCNATGGCSIAMHATATAVPCGTVAVSSTDKTFPGGASCDSLVTPVAVSVGKHLLVDLRTTDKPFTCQAVGTPDAGAVSKTGGVTCALPAGLCKGGACVMRPPSGAKLCLLHDGAVACPSPSLKGTTIFAGESVRSTLQCQASCSCLTQAGNDCTVTSVTAQASADCSGTTTPLTLSTLANGGGTEVQACSPQGPTTGSVGYDSIQVAANAPSCFLVGGGLGGAPTGGVSPGGSPETLCCE